MKRIMILAVAALAFVAAVDPPEAKAQIRQYANSSGLNDTGKDAGSVIFPGMTHTPGKALTLHVVAKSVSGTASFVCVAEYASNYEGTMVFEPGTASTDSVKITASKLNGRIKIASLTDKQVRCNCKGTGTQVTVLDLWKYGLP